jgi:hypothetical protein
MEGTPVEHGLKGATAKDLQKMANCLPGSTPLTTPFGHAMQKTLGRRNPNESFGYGFEKSAPVEPATVTGQPRTLSEYEKRQRNQ